MQSNLFDLSFQHWDMFLLSIVPALINVGIFLYASFCLTPNRTSIAFSFFVLLLGIYQLTDGLVRMSASAETAMDWSRISNSPSLFVLSFGLLFTLRYTGWNKKIPKILLLVLLFLPSMLFEFMMIARLDNYTVVKSEKWTWIINPEPNLITSAIYIWIAIQAMVMLALLWLNYFKVRNEFAKKNQALLLAIGFSVPAVVGITTEMVFPLLLETNGVPLTTPLICIFSILAFIAIRKYHFLNFSPRHQWDKIVETMNEGILIVNNHDRIMYANKTFCKQLEYEFEEIKGRIASELFFDNTDDKKAIENTIEERMAKKSGQYEIRLKTKSGKEIWMQISGTPYMNTKGKVVGSIGIHTNTTARKKIEEELLNNQSRLNQAQAIAHLGSWQLDFANDYVLWSDEACRIYGLLPSENKQSYETWLSFIHREDLADVLEMIKESQRTLNTSSFYHRIVRKDGSIRFIHSQSKFEFGPNGKPIGIYGIAHDITDQKKSEEKLIATNKELETFIYKASHDLRGPLTSIMGLTNLSKMEIVDEKSLHLLDMIDTSTKRLDNILIGLVNTMKIKDTKQFNDKIDFTQMIHETLKKIEYCEGYSRLHISNSVSTKVPFISSKLIVESIFQNMIENAIKYQNPETKHSFLTINISDSDKKVQIVFEDNGIGMDTSIHNKIFEMYFRGGHQSQGSGLGLYLVSIGIKKLGGEIKFKSEKNIGTKFIISLPVTEKVC